METLSTEKLSKNDAREIVLERWRRRQESMRQTADDAQSFAESCSDVVFETLGDCQRIIFGWIVLEMRAYPPKTAKVAKPTKPAKASKPKIVR